MAAYSRDEAIRRAKVARQDAADLQADILFAREDRIIPEHADEMRAALEFIIEQSHDTIEEN